MDGAPDIASEVHQHEVAGAPADLQPDGEGAFWIELEGNQRLAHLAALRGPPLEQPIGFELAHDDGHRLRRKTCEPRHLGFRQLAMQPDQGEHQPLVVEPHAGLRRATRQRRVAFAPYAAASPFPCHGKLFSDGPVHRFPALGMAVNNKSLGFTY